MMNPENMEAIRGLSTLGFGAFCLVVMFMTPDAKVGRVVAWAAVAVVSMILTIFMVLTQQ